MSKIILIGHGGSGKDFLLKKMTHRGYNKAISYTTRQPRQGEIPGVDYHYITEQQFHQMTQDDIWHEMDCYRGWYYGSTKEDFKSKNIFIKTPEGIQKMSDIDRAKCFVIYLDIPENIRRERLIARNDVDSVERRLASDALAFENFKDYDLRITNPFF